MKFIKSSIEKILYKQFQKKKFVKKLPCKKNFLKRLFAREVCCKSSQKSFLEKLFKKLLVMKLYEKLLTATCNNIFNSS